MVSIQRLGSELSKLVPDYKAFLGKKLITVIKEHEDLFETRAQGQDKHIEVRLRK